ncbi:coiled-coil domain-containing protein 174-like [Diadema antillarum]|uniref:coiled-coil domain-containing protein 174-like n=1 Tax=Diadema antillarum TaxID=105358 RepID=UPI003A8410E7
MNKSNKINVNVSSLVDLKAELFKKQEQLKRDRLQTQQQGGSSASTTRARPAESKKPSIWSKKNAGVKARAEKDLEKLEEERNELENARSKLEAKAKFYEKMTKDGGLPNSDGGEHFLVDFEKKALDNLDELRSRGVGPLPREEAEKEEVDRLAEDDEIPPPANRDEEWVDYTDSLGRSRRCMRKDLPHLISMDKNLNPQAFQEKEEKKTSEKGEELPDLMSNDMYREMLRKKWEAEEEAAANGPQGPTHYQNVKYDEVRDLGVGYFDFSKDQTERNEQMERLQLLRDETLGQRQRREKLKAKRKAAMKARLEKVKERKRQRGELVEDEEEEEEEEEETVVPEKKKKDGAEQARLADAPEQDGSPREAKVREWDIGKEPVSPWEQRLDNVRNERPSEFAPPSSYESSGWKKPQRSKPQFPPLRDYTSSYGKRTERTEGKSSALGSQWNNPGGSGTGTQPFAAAGDSYILSQRGRGNTSSDSKTEDAISSALSFFRTNANQ